MRVVSFESYDIRDFFLYTFYVSKRYSSFATGPDGDMVE